MAQRRQAPARREMLWVARPPGRESGAKAVRSRPSVEARKAPRRTAAAGTVRAWLRRRRRGRVAVRGAGGGGDRTSRLASSARASEWAGAAAGAAPQGCHAR
eukprot:7101734-Prymnesium_polylepis.1